jgi:hypothetical protein
MTGVLQFDREAVRPTHLVVIDGEAGAAAGTRSHAIRQAISPALLVVLATVVAVAVDLVDTVPRWSHVAIAGSVLVLALHRAMLLRRS